MATPTIADVLIDELAILERRDHPPRERQVPEQPPAPADPAAAAARLARNLAREAKVQKIHDYVHAASDTDAQMVRARVAMLDEHVTGLSFSGGGIRAGTFAVGFLQGLANLGLLERFDYLSTVSGGGYAGGWLTAWLKREGDVKNVERQLDFSHVRQAQAQRGEFRWDRDPLPAVDEEPEPLRHLRAYSSYLFPNPGPLSVDTWSVIMIWLRNVLINLLLLFPLAMLAVLDARLGVYFFNFLNADNIASVNWGWFFANLFLIGGLASAMLALVMTTWALPEFRSPQIHHRARSERERKKARWKAHLALIFTIAAAFGLTVSSRWMLWHLGESFPKLVEGFRGDGGDTTIMSTLFGLVSGYLDLLQLPSFLLVMTIFALFMAIGSFVNGLRYRAQGAVRDGGIHRRGERRLRVRAGAGDDPRVCATEPPRPDDDLRDPRGACGGDRIDRGRSRDLGAVDHRGRARVVGASHRPAGSRVDLLDARHRSDALPARGIPGGRGGPRVAIASGWLGTTALGVLTGRFVLPKLQAKGGGQIVAKVAALAPPIFLVGLIGLVGLLASLLLNSPALNAPHGDDLTPFAYYLEGVRGTSVWMILLLAFAFGGLAFVGSKLIDVNLFSLNAMYANRLIRCYLGASRQMENWQKRWVDVPRDMTVDAGAPSVSLGASAPSVRDPNPVTDFDPGDDLPLSDLRIGGTGMGQREYWGPHLLVNTTLNLVAGTDLARQSRKGESFLLSPLYCGAKGVGYVKLDADNPEVRANLTLGRAISISGAAVDPNMSFYQSPALTALLAVFDARLGSWMQNPRMIKEKKKKRRHPRHTEQRLDGREPEVRRPARDRAVGRDRRHGKICPPLRRRPL